MSDVVLVLSGARRLRLEGDDFCSWVDELIVRSLPQCGPRPPDAHHLIGFHGNDSAKVRLRPTGPTEIEVVANDPRVEAEAEAGAVSRRSAGAPGSP